ncbi:MAG: hypothetical protein K0S83_600 [Thermomicrobiales bacterium]|nr:hypothetical protein [Thermomicrobiales bacterium]
MLSPQAKKLVFPQTSATVSRDPSFLRMTPGVRAALAPLAECGLKACFELVWRNTIDADAFATTRGA